MDDWMIVLVIGAVVFFGATKLPEIARNVERAQGEFKKGLREGGRDSAAEDGPATADLSSPDRPRR